MYENEQEGVQNSTVSPTAQEFSTEALLARCRDLLFELESFEAYLQQRKKGKTVDLNTFKNTLRAELKSLEKVDPRPTEQTIHSLRSSNLPFYQAVWDAAKACRGVVAINKRFSIIDDNIGVPTTRTTKRRNVLVDIVAEGGAEWVKVSTITETRFLFEMAKNGWEFSQGKEEDDDNGELDSVEDSQRNAENETTLSLLKLAKDLQRAAK